MRSNQQSRAGFTLIEIMISMTLLLFVLGIATNSFRKQSALLAAQSGRLEAQQTAQFTLSELDRELRLAGVGVADMQPVIVQADSMAFTFNADLVSNVVNDPSAVYVDLDADDDASMAWKSTHKANLPNSVFTYPDSTHMKSVGAPSAAETISFWLSRDSTNLSLTNRYILYRSVNGGTRRMVARGVVRNANDTVFQYFKPDTTGLVIPIVKTLLPKYHTAKTHGQASDTGQFALVDSIVQVRVRLTLVYDDRKGPIYRRLDSTIRLMNGGLVRRSTCGDAPLPVTPTVVASVDTLGPKVTVTWPKSGDEGAGEKDVERYSLYKRYSSEAVIEDMPFASIPAGPTAPATSYTYVDREVATGESWIYGAASQDCSPSLSGVTFTSAIVIP